MIAHYLVFCIIVLYSVQIISYAEETQSIISDEESLSSLTNLLNSMVKVNEDRVQAMKKMATLQDYLLTKIDDYVPDERTDTGKASIQRNEGTNRSEEKETYKYNNGTRKEPSGSRSDEDSSIESDKISVPHPEIARCYGEIYIKRARRSCVNACDRAFENVCDEHRCTRAAERSGERECRKQCRNRFDTA